MPALMFRFPESPRTGVCQCLHAPRAQDRQCSVGRQRDDAVCALCCPRDMGVDAAFMIEVRTC